MVAEGGPSLAQYGRFGDAGEESLTLLTDFLSRQENIPTFAEIEGWTPYSVPCIIKVLVGDALSYDLH